MLMVRSCKRVLPILMLSLISVLRGAAPPAPAQASDEPAQNKAANGATEILFKDDFEQPGSGDDTTKWRRSKNKETDVIEVRPNAWPHAGGFAGISDSGDQGGTYHGYSSAIASKMSFRRGRNLRCTFRVAMPAHTGTGF